MLATWNFHRFVPADRALRLLSYPTFAAATEELRHAPIEKFAWEPFDGPLLRDCHRAAALLKVSTDGYDAFFNSPVGYRGQFALSPALGESANRSLFLAIAPRVLDFAVTHANVSPELLRASLSGIDAKLWIYEPEVTSQLGAETAAINYPVWEKGSSSGVGLLAPVGTLIELKGGWIQNDGSESRNPSKLGRSKQIYLEGFS